ncbi:MAG: Asp-tRNA(Asn)/Glu-tRNA(Gln) amidotransferase subunit GatB [Patescibacteria group bacterium]|nr:Asp-tRNA(Asn)/Glu-tRNA(Gln) amidotransferase subunit GatB [Patescibacteria group bacterium]
MTEFTPVIGLEIHLQLKTRSKMFCASLNGSDGADPNTNICEVCTGQPGSLPVANREAIEKAILMGLALNCEIAEYSKFDRKNYFYPDLPKGYQISQFDKPICGKGEVRFEVGGKECRVSITRAHLEEDAGKLIHPVNSDYSLVDLNRAGTPLLETVTEPDFTSPEQAKAFLQHLRTLARYLGVSDADMEKGQLRCDANISMRPHGSSALPNYKVEVKNMNSFKAVEEALTYEIERQSAELAEGRKLATETRGWSDEKKVTLSQRSKEGSDDYRYFPEPDLPVLHFTREFVETIRSRLPELPAAKRARLISEYNLPEKLAGQLVEDKFLAEYFEAVVSELSEWLSVAGEREPEKLKALVKEAANWCAGIFTELLNAAGIAAGESKVTPENFAELLKMIEKSEVSKTAAKAVFAEMFETGEDPSNIVEEKGLKQVSDAGAIEAVFDKVMAGNPKWVADYKAGKTQVAGSFIGAVMKETKGKANPQVVNEILKKKLE